MNRAQLVLWARRMKTEVIAVYLAGRDPRTPPLAKVAALAVAAYALSPIDLIPDFIPVLGWLDDLILVPLGILLVLRLVPAPLMAEFRATARTLDRLPASRTAALLIVALWLLALAAAALWSIRRWA